MGIDCRDGEAYWDTVTIRCGRMDGLFVEKVANNSPHKKQAEKLSVGQSGTTD